MKSKNLWFSFIAVLVICFSILGFYGHEIYREKPPIPEKIISEDGSVIFTNYKYNNSGYPAMVNASIYNQEPRNPAPVGVSH